MQDIRSKNRGNRRWTSMNQGGSSQKIEFSKEGTEA